ncbi:MAG: rod shape-determining protein RodA [Candidatus Pacebacteria bacterium]|nr:rod shape-determining protein RodA [Candidatus Paceibacterota bacterium]
MKYIPSVFKKIDWVLFLATVPILAAGLSTMYSFTGDNAFAFRQLLWITASIIVFFTLSMVDMRFLRSRATSIFLFVGSMGILSTVFVIGKVSHGAANWIDLGLFSFQPSDFAKLALIVILAKYFSRRHIEIANIRHIIVSGAYAFIFFALILLHPDLGSSIIVFLIWVGMVMVSGISKKHLFALVALVAIGFTLLWFFAFRDYQKQRIINFVHPLTDVRGSGYNSYQSTVAVGSGEWFGKGVGYGTQSRLKFLPEYQTDFIFAAFSEEWGFVGVVIFFTLYGVLIWRIIVNASRGATNFEILYGAGVAVFFIVHLIINVGMNIHLLPVTGTPLPLMSYGGTHVMTEFIALGTLMAMRRYARPAHKDAVKNEFLGPQ